MLDAIFPKQCVFCKKTGAFLCPSCQDRLRVVSGEICPICGIPFESSKEKHLCSCCQKNKPYYDRHRSIFVFDEMSKKLIHDLKYHAAFWINNIFPLFFKNIALELDNGLQNKISFIVPIPLHKEKLKQRGFNQSLILAEAWGDILGAPVYSNLLLSQKQVPSQTGLKKAQRRKNLKDAFSVKTPSLCQDKTALLVDDVHTTGSTLNEAACELKKAGVKEVAATTIALVL